MIRMLLWILVVYIVWKIIDVYISSKRRRPEDRKPDSGFSKVEEADYEDITPKPTPPEQKTTESR